MYLYILTDVLVVQKEQLSDSYREFLTLCNRLYLMGVTSQGKQESTFQKLGFQISSLAWLPYLAPLS